ncbi:MAG TPA: beta-1,3-glucanase family protein [Gemmataceae bacterium]|nr:beta-1,3-glucanase family protein [Gemmataceae bacterium]
MTSLSHKRIARASGKVRRCVRPMLECLEDRNLLSASDATFSFTIPANGGYPGGDDIYFYVIGTETNGQQVYLNSASNGQWLTPTGQNVPSVAKVPTSAGTGTTPLTISLPSGTSVDGRIVMSVGTIPITTTASSIESLDPNLFPNNVYDYVEFTYTHNAAGYDSLNTDLSQEDQVGLTSTIDTTGYNQPSPSATPTSLTFGSTLSDTTLQTAFSTYITKAATTSPSAALFQQLLNPTTSPPTTVSRLVSPTEYLEHYNSSSQLSSYFDPEIESFFNHYTATNSFVLDDSGYGVFTGNVTTTNGFTVLQLTNPHYSGDFDIYEPVFNGSQNTSYPAWFPAQSASESSGQMVFANDGVFATGGEDTTQTNAGALDSIEGAIDAAFARGIATNFSLAPSDWVLPYGITYITASPGPGGNLQSGTYYYVINAVNTAGTTVASNEVSVPVGSNQSVTLNWQPTLTPTQQQAQDPLDPLLGVTQYNIYRSTSPGNEEYIGSVLNTGSTSSYTDTGTPSTSTTPPYVFYPTNGTFSYYSAFLHQPNVMENGYAYALPHDDIGNQSTDATVFSNSTNTSPMTAAITLSPWSSSPPSPPSSPSPSQSPSSSDVHLGQLVTVYLLAQDEFTYLVDGVFLMLTNDSLFTQAADRLMSLLNTRLPVDNHALFSGQSGLQSAILSNPYFGGAWGNVAAQTALESAVYDFFLLTKHHGKPS